MKERYLSLEDWYYVKFSEEVYFRYGLQDKLHIICKLGKQYYLDCIQEDKKSDKKDKKHYYTWATVGYNFKLEIYFYEMSGNTNRKISQKVYIDQIFQPIIKL